ncbi:hypothetical protein ElyMa_003511000 [Elysia marginata]|uniref:Uncharacterized protein n=1 Tax=Elysia marginata TaxID=1093978 RepID=A0AAV4EGH3_9GAST|nr:hypothetical protein ElyMa_003511000 [Elysia marginata]
MARKYLRNLLAPSLGLITMEDLPFSLYPNPRAKFADHLTNVEGNVSVLKTKPVAFVMFKPHNCYNCLVVRDISLPDPHRYTRANRDVMASR